MDTMFESLQKDVYNWSENQFPGQPSVNPALGMVEEFAELQEELMSGLEKEEEMDAVGDIIVYTADFCERRDLSLSEAAKTEVVGDNYQNLNSEFLNRKDPLTGALIALGRLYRSILKQRQGIRQNEQRVGSEAEQRAVALLIDRLDAFTSERDYTLRDCIETAWDQEVSDREWDSSYN